MRDRKHMFELCATCGHLVGAHGGAAGPVPPEIDPCRRFPCQCQRFLRSGKYDEDAIEHARRTRASLDKWLDSVETRETDES
jgi:hypothetical protein